MSKPAPAATAVYRWDLDKTYVQTDFHSVAGLVRAALETPADKKPVPGMRALLRALSEAHEARIIVVSGSPELLRARILAMFELHGIRCDRLVLKEWAKAVRRGRLRNIRGQIAYKLRAHIETRLWLQAGNADVGEYCFGDDAEVDGLVYCMYADACSRRLDATRLRALLLRTGAYPDEVTEILRLLAEVPRHDPVRRVFIHLDARSPPARYATYLGRVTPTFDALQIAVCLADGGHADDDVVREVVDALVTLHRIDGTAIAGSLEDATARGLCRVKTARRIAAEVILQSEASAVGFDPEYAARVDRRLAGCQQDPAASAPAALPYEQLVVDEAAFAVARRIARKAAADMGGMRAFLERRTK